jgi:hypothetical protein
MTETVQATAEAMAGVRPTAKRMSIITSSGTAGKFIPRGMLSQAAAAMGMEGNILVTGFATHPPRSPAASGDCSPRTYAFCWVVEARAPRFTAPTLDRRSGGQRLHAAVCGAAGDRGHRGRDRYGG